VDEVLLSTRGETTVISIAAIGLIVVAFIVLTIKELINLLQD
jgi:hypothetical protein